MGNVYAIKEVRLDTIQAVILVVSNKAGDVLCVRYGDPLFGFGWQHGRREVTDNEAREA